MNTNLGKLLLAAPESTPRLCKRRKATAVAALVFFEAPPVVNPRGELRATCLFTGDEPFPRAFAFRFFVRQKASAPRMPSTATTTGVAALRSESGFNLACTVRVHNPVHSKSKPQTNL